MYPKPSAETVARLRYLADVPSLEIRFNAEEAERSGSPSWRILYNEEGKPAWICDWPDVLDGNLSAIAAKMRRWDNRHNGGQEAATRAVLDAADRAREARRKRKHDFHCEFARYIRKAVQRLDDELY